MFIATLVIGNQVLPSDKAVTRGQLGYDFTAFYAGGSFLYQGRADLLYNLDAVREHEVKTLTSLGLKPADSVGPWWNPPFYAWLFAPLAAFSFHTALGIWTCITVTCLGVSIFMLCRMLTEPRGAARETSWRDWGLIPLLILFSMPFLQAISHGQNSFTSLLLVTSAVAAWRGGRAVVAGMIAGLLFYKPQLGTVLAGMMVLTLGWRALMGVGVTGIFLLGVNVITLPGTLSTYLHRLPVILHYMQVERPYLWERHVTLKAFWRMLLQGRSAGEASWLVQLLTFAGCGALVYGLGKAVIGWRKSRAMHALAQTELTPHFEIRRRGPRPPRPNPMWAYKPVQPHLKVTGRKLLAPLELPAPHAFDAIIAATITAMPLLMPFYFDYDLMLLAVPATLLAGERMRETRTLSSDKWLVRAWVALYLWLLVNPGMTTMTHVNLSVPLLSAVAGLSVARAIRLVTPRSATRELPSPKPRAVAA